MGTTAQKRRPPVLTVAWGVPVACPLLRQTCCGLVFGGNFYQYQAECCVLLLCTFSVGDPSV